MASLLTELKRRNVFKVAVAYAIVAWLIVQVAGTFFPALHLPDWTVTFVAALLLLGFPVALLLSWAYELTPEGVKKTRSVPLAESITHISGRKIDYLIIGFLVLAVGFMYIDNYLPQNAPEQTFAPEVAEPDTEPAPESPAPTAIQEARGVLPNSVAVLPFENLSPDPDNAYFAAGIHEEVLNHLTKLSALNVIARTSMMQYAGGDKAIPQIAEELNVETVMEGSVRYADDRVLVTAQLIDPVTNAHLWSESYNREFADIFAIQADIAMNIANALEAEFSLEEQANIEKLPTDSPEAYRFYLAALNSGGPGNRELQLDYYNRAIEADPEFAHAYIGRAWTGAITLNRVDTLTQSEFEARVANTERLAIADIEKAQSIDPTLIETYLLQAYIHEQNWRGADALNAYARAYELNPNHPWTLNNYGAFHARVGNYEEALRLAERRKDLAPSEFGNIELARNLMRVGETDRGVALLRETLERNPGQAAANRELAIFESANGNSAKAKAHLDVIKLQALRDVNIVRLVGLARSYAQLGFDEDAAELLAEFERRAENRRVPTVARVSESLLHGDRERALYWIERVADEQEPYQGFQQIMALKHNRNRDPILDEPEFVEVRNRLGFTDI